MSSAIQTKLTKKAALGEEVFSLFNELCHSKLKTPPALSRITDLARMRIRQTCSIEYIRASNYGKNFKDKP